MRPSQNVERLEKVLLALGTLSDQLVFTGGAVVEFYAEMEQGFPPRVTNDVDCIVAAATLTEYHKIEAELHKRGFVNAGLMGQRGPNCRYLLGDLILDIMPDVEKVLGFSNKWFTYALQNPTEHKLPSGKKIRLVSFPRALAIKLETLSDRGGTDIRGSHDLEDIVRLISGRADPVAEVEREIREIKSFIRSAARELLSNGMIMDALSGASPLGLEQAREVREILRRIERGKRK